MPNPGPERWAKRHRLRAGVSVGDDPGPYLRAISWWQAVAQEVAEDHNRHELKQAVREVPPDEEAQEALHALYGLWGEDIWHVCRKEYDSYQQSGHRDEPGLSFGGVLQESYVLFLRAMVRAETKYEMLNRLRARLAEHVESHLLVRDDPKNRAPLESDRT
jgi:hypothetical protein